MLSPRKMQKIQPAGIVFLCPHCQHLYSDEMECLQHNDLHEMTCESCEEAFLFLFAECLVCGEETTFSWRDGSELPDRSDLLCAHCDEPLLRKEEEDNDVGSDS